MATHTQKTQEPSDFGRKSRPVFLASAGIGIAALGAAVGLSAMGGGFSRFLFAYLVALMSVLAVGLGALMFVLVQHLTRAGWSVNIRRVAENMMMTIPVLGILTLPLVVAVLMQRGTPYPWALPLSAAQKVDAHHADSHGSSPADPHAANPAETAKDAAHPQTAGKTLDPLTLEKRAYLNPIFFTIRIVAYFAIWTFIAWWYWKRSVQQDLDGDIEHTKKMQRYSGAAIAAILLTVTYATFDLIMSLDPHWYSTIMGIYYIAGCAVSFFAAAILAVTLLKRAGFLKVVDADHYHDLGKFMFAFVFFWGYIAFSQYMLIWYASLPETVTWFARRGVSSVTDLKSIPNSGQTWTPVAIALLAGNLLIPFAGLLSRHVKRNTAVVTFWAIWLLVFHVINLYWVIMPEMRIGFKPAATDFAAVIGMASVGIAAWIYIAGRSQLRPVNDPRVQESVAFTNV